MTGDLQRTVDELFRLARWVRGSEEGQCLTYAERVYIAFTVTEEGVKMRPMPEPSKEVPLTQIHDAIEGLCEKGMASAVLAIGDSLLVSSPSVTDRVTVDHLINMGCTPHEIAEVVKDAHFVLSAALYTAEGCVLSYNATVDSCSAFNKLIGDKGRERVLKMNNDDDPPSSVIGDLDAMWWKTRADHGQFEEFFSDLGATPEENDDIDWN